VRGFPVHVFEAGAGSNAITAAYHLIQSLEKLEAEWNERATSDRHFKAVPHPINFNPGIIKGGDWASSVPAWCDVDCRIAILPGWSVADCQAEIVACISAAARDHRFLSNNPPGVEWSGFLSEGYELKDSAEPEAAFGKAYNAVYGGAVADLAFTALTDTRFYGLNYNIPSLCFGASGAAMHGFNEYVDLESLRKAFRAAVVIPSYLEKLTRDYFVKLGCVELVVLGIVTGAPNITLIFDATEVADQEYDTPLREEKAVQLSDVSTALKHADEVLIFPGAFSLADVCAMLPATARLSVTPERSLKSGSPLRRAFPLSRMTPAARTIIRW
jgi:hypothetical protein